MSNIENLLQFTRSHEWLKIEDDTTTIGITDYAQESLGDLVFVELPEVGRVIEVGETIGVLESVKTASDLFAPISGEIIEVNEQLQDTPEMINSDPYEAGWILKVKHTQPLETEELLDEAFYKATLD